MQKHRFNPWVRNIPWRRKWQPTPVFLSGKFHEQRSLAGYSPNGRKELDANGWLSMHALGQGEGVVSSNLSSLLKSNKIIRKKDEWHRHFLIILSLGFYCFQGSFSTVATDLENFLLSFTGLYLKIQLLGVSELAEYASLIQVVVHSCTH